MPFKHVDVFLCLIIRSSLSKKIGIKFLIACWSGSQELAEVFEPKTWLVDMKYQSCAIKPKVPVISQHNRGKRKHAVMSASATSMISQGKPTCQL